MTRGVVIKHFAGNNHDVRIITLGLPNEDLLGLQI